MITINYIYKLFYSIVRKKMGELISTGIPGLDEIFKGGIRKYSSILITGAPGTGKSIAALQFIYEGAKNGEPSLYITAEETTASLREYAKSIGIDIDTYEKKGLLILMEERLTGGKIVSIQAPMDVIKKKKIKRVALDSLTLFEYVYSSNVLEFRRGVLEFIKSMKEANVTLLATSETKTTDIDNFIYSPRDFLFEGLIILIKVRKGNSFERCLCVAKMRGQSHSLDIYPLKITEKGMKVLPKQIPFSLIEKDIIKKGF